MRRLLAITMTLLFGFMLGAPLFVADAASNLPECCRRNGRHHCMAGMMGSSGSRTISTVAPRCPNFPRAIAAPAPHSFTAAEAGIAGISVFVHPASAPQTEARYRVSYARSRQKRGPPAAITAS